MLLLAEVKVEGREVQKAKKNRPHSGPGPSGPVLEGVLVVSAAFPDGRRGAGARGGGRPARAEEGAAPGRLRGVQAATARPRAAREPPGPGQRRRRRVGHGVGRGRILLPGRGPAGAAGGTAADAQRAADEASARAWDQFTATTREAIKRDTPLLASVVDFNVKERWIAVAALEEYLKVPKYAVFTTLLETNRSSLARIGVHYTKIGHALHVIIIDHTKPGAQEMPTHRTVAELGKAMDVLSSREVAKLFGFWGFGDKAIELVLESDMGGATLLALGPREFKEMGFTEPDGLFRLIAPKAKEMNRKGGAPYSVIS